MTLEAARNAYRVRAWTEALRTFEGLEDLGPEDLERFATAAYLTGEHDRAVRRFEQAYASWRAAARPLRAAQCACYLGFVLMGGGDRSRAGGWFGRASRLVEDFGEPCAQQGWVMLPHALRIIGGGNAAEAFDIFSQAIVFGERFGDADLTAYARHGQGRTKIRLGDVAEGMALLDEAMVDVESGDVSPILSGVIYCSAIEACREIFDLRRAQLWTAALQAWCEGQEDLVPYRGQCLAHRAEILRMQGDWPGSQEEAERACAWLTRPRPRPAAGAAYYQLGEVLRLLGKADAAERAYTEAMQYGRTPHPGLALLRMDQGDSEAASNALARVLAEAQHDGVRANVLPAWIDVSLDVGNVEQAEAASRELAALADSLDAPALRAHAWHGRGRILLERDEAPDALPVLRRALEAWLEIGNPFEAARVRARIGVACARLGDEDTAALHVAAARSTFEHLGAAPELERTMRAVASDRRVEERPGGLTDRELEVLRRVAAGDSNKRIGTTLGISERTVERHVSNIFDKTGVSSRAAATAFAYENDML